MSEAINYKLTFDELNKHLLKVECTITRPNLSGQIVSLPAWIPGSYMIRDLAKHVVAISAASKGRPISIQKIDKNTWQCEPCTAELVITYQVYCFDLMPRGAYIDSQRIFFDGCRIFLIVHGEEELTRSLEIVRPVAAQAKSWRCATSMTPKKVDQHGYGKYIAENHLELIDHPFEISDFKQFDFIVADVPHSLVVSGCTEGDLERLATDLQKVCAGCVDLFGELPVMRSYLFILHVYTNGYGGIEHRSSCTLSCSLADLPIVGDASGSEDYNSLLGLCSHEYFHLWNVKRIKPEVFVNPDLTQEAYTRQLWIFEGITSYYDNLNLVRHNIISFSDYLTLLQKNITSLQQTPGAYIQTLDDSSFDAWIKFYQPNENSVNAAVSYYLKGSLVALALDLLIIRNTRCKQSLLDIMQILWQQYGKTGLGLPENYFEHLVYEIIGEDYKDFFASSLRTTDPLPLPELFLEVGVIQKYKYASLTESIGLRLSADQNRLLVKSSLYGSSAEIAGIAANDEIIAVNGIAVNGGNIESILKRNAANRLVKVHLFRNDVLLEVDLCIPELQNSVCELEIVQDTNSTQQLNRDKWVGTLVSS